jgi:prevent-host-death family protein
MKVASQNEVAADFSEYVKAAKKEPVVVTNEGKPVAVLLHAQSEEDVERVLMGHSPKLQAMLEAARKRFREGHGIPHDEFWNDADSKGSPKPPQRGRRRKTG